MTDNRDNDEGPDPDIDAILGAFDDQDPAQAGDPDEFDGPPDDDVQDRTNQGDDDADEDDDLDQGAGDDDDADDDLDDDDDDDIEDVTPVRSTRVTGRPQAVTSAGTPQKGSSSSGTSSPSGGDPFGRSSRPSTSYSRSLLLKPKAKQLGKPKRKAKSRFSGMPGLVAQSGVPRSDFEIEELAGFYNQDVITDKFNNRGSKETMQWVAQITKGIEHKFTMSKSDALDLERLDSVYDLAMRVNDLKRFVRERGLSEAFQIRIFDRKGNIEDAVDLFENYGTITLKQVVQNVEFVKRWETDPLVWVETLTLSLVANSCDEDLQEKVNEKMLNLPIVQLGGATYFKLAIDAITSMSDDVSLSLIQKINTMTLRKLPGEDVLTAISILRGALKRLEMNDMVPKHIVTIVYRIFQTSSSDKFNHTFSSIYATEQKARLLGHDADLMSVEDLFRLAESQYRTLVETGGWIQTKKKSSAFTSEATSSDGSNKQKKLPPWRRPPAEGEPDERKFKGKTEYWCAKCGSWNKTHKTDQHRTKEELAADRNAQQLQANNQEAQSSSDTSSADVADDAGSTTTTTASSNAAFLTTGIRT